MDTKKLFSLIQSRRGFSLLEVLASAMVILSVSATVSHLASHPRAVNKELERKFELVNYMHHKLQDLNQASTPLPTAAIRYCSACNNTVTGCSNFCTSQYAAECTSSQIDDNLNAIQTSTNACYVSVLIDPTCDDVGDVTPDIKKSQICAGGLIQRSGGVDEHALSTYLFRS